METKLQFPVGPVIKCFVKPPNSKLRKNCEEIVCFTSTDGEKALGTRLITCESRDHVVQCFPGRLVSFDPRHVTRSPSIGKRS